MQLTEFVRLLITLLN